MITLAETPSHLDKYPRTIILEYAITYEYAVLACLERLQIQYKGVFWPVKEFPFWWSDDLPIVLSWQWDLLYK